MRGRNINMPSTAPAIRGCGAVSSPGLARITASHGTGSRTMGENGVFLTPFSGNRLRKRARSCKRENPSQDIFLPSQRDLRRRKRRDSLLLPCAQKCEILDSPASGWADSEAFGWGRTRAGPARPGFGAKREKYLKCRNGPLFPLLKPGQGQAGPPLPDPAARSRPGRPGHRGDFLRVPERTDRGPSTSTNRFFRDF